MTRKLHSLPQEAEEPLIRRYSIEAQAALASTFADAIQGARGGFPKKKDFPPPLNFSKEWRKRTTPKNVLLVHPTPTKSDLTLNMSLAGCVLDEVSVPGGMIKTPPGNAWSKVVPAMLRRFHGDGDEAFYRLVGYLSSSSPLIRWNETTPYLPSFPLLLPSLSRHRFIVACVHPKQEEKRTAIFFCIPRYKKDLNYDDVVYLTADPGGPTGEGPPTTDPPLFSSSSTHSASERIRRLCLPELQEALRLVVINSGLFDITDKDDLVMMGDWKWKRSSKSLIVSYTARFLSFFLSFFLSLCVSPAIHIYLDILHTFPPPLPIYTPSQRSLFFGEEELVHPSARAPSFVESQGLKPAERQQSAAAGVKKAFKCPHVLAEETGEIITCKNGQGTLAEYVSSGLMKLHLQLAAVLAVVTEAPPGRLPEHIVRHRTIFFSTLGIDPEDGAPCANALMAAAADKTDVFSTLQEAVCKVHGNLFSYKNGE